VHAGASSSLGKMLVKQCKKEGITLINIVRREESAQALRDLGAEHILNQTAPTFDADMKAMFETLKPSAFFDPVTGEVGTKIIKALPAHAVTWTYGALDMSPYGLDASTLIFTGKCIRGFWLSHFLQKNPEQAKEFAMKTVGDLSSGDSAIIIRERFELKDWEKALEASNVDAWKGKVIFKN